MRGNYVENRREQIMSTLDYLPEAFVEKHKFFKKFNVPMVFIMGNLAMQKDIKPSDFKTFIDWFAGSDWLEYKVNTGSGEISRELRRRANSWICPNASKITSNCLTKRESR